MITTIIQITDWKVKATIKFSSTQEYCVGFFCEGDAEFSVTITPQDICLEREKAAQEDALEGLPIRNLSDNMLEITALQRKIAEEFFSRNILLFHGSVVAVDNSAYLFTAKSGTGKSTHTRLWREVFGDRAVMVNDDKPFLQLTEDGVIAHGSPWNGKHRLGSNISVPLKAICILERSAKNWVKPITPAEALPMLFQQSQWPQNPANMPKYMELIDRLANGVEFYRMGCNMDPDAARISYEAMSGDRKDDRA